MPAFNHGEASGFTLLELLVAMALFSLIGLSVLTLSSSVLHDMGTESRMVSESMELSRALGLLSSELRMSSSLSPYLPGTNSALYKCSGTVLISSYTVKFFVVEEDPTALLTSGIKAYYVGYRYDPINKTLLRGEIALNSIYSCTVPATDPTSSTYAKTLATHVTAIDTNGDGIAETAFAKSGNMLSVNLGVQVNGAGGISKLQKLQTKVFERIS